MPLARQPVLSMTAMTEVKTRALIFLAGPKLQLPGSQQLSGLKHLPSVRQRFDPNLMITTPP